MYHVFIDLNPQASRNPTAYSNLETGMLAKSVQLPKFNIQNKIYNSYNRKNITQERINYDPVTLTFHDDSDDVVRGFWQGYYSYYYRDGDNTEQIFNLMNQSKYAPRQSQNWGFSPLTQSEATVPYINAIRIYSLHQKKFSSYFLMNPIIQSFQHGQHAAGEYTPMEHTMTVAYEGVLYGTGAVSGGTVQGFDVVHYDKSPSPLTSLGGGTTSILGPGGLVQGAGDVLTNLQNGNFGAAAVGGLHTFNNFNNVNLGAVATGELAATAQNILKGNNPTSPVFVPTSGSVQTALSTAVNQQPGLISANGGNMNSVNNLLPNLNGGIASLLNL